MSKELDFDNLSDEDLEYIKMRGNVADQRRAGLLPNPDFDLGNVPGSLLPHELDGSGEPTFDMDSKVAAESVGEPGAMESSLLKLPEVNALPEPVPYEPKDASKPAAPSTSPKTVTKAAKA